MARVEAVEKKHTKADEQDIDTIDGNANDAEENNEAAKASNQTQADKNTKDA